MLHRFIGANAIKGYKRIRGMSVDIPVDTDSSHWREETFADELMSGYATGGMTVSLPDISR